jgi:hypothetical protein
MQDADGRASLSGLLNFSTSPSTGILQEHEVSETGSVSILK